ncbi:MAG: hypothetical protein ACXQS4_05025 [Methermicoccaceae archaeon]
MFDEIIDISVCMHELHAEKGTYTEQDIREYEDDMSNMEMERNQMMDKEDHLMSTRTALLTR